MELLALVWVAIVVNEAHSAPQVDKPGNARSGIMNYHSENRGVNGYDFSYETAAGTKRVEKGEFVNGIWTVTGAFEWRSSDGKIHKTIVNTG